VTFLCSYWAPNGTFLPGLENEEVVVSNQISSHSIPSTINVTDNDVEHWQEVKASFLGRVHDATCAGQLPDSATKKSLVLVLSTKRQALLKFQRFISLYSLHVVY
jgi:hypothetical protein